MTITPSMIYWITRFDVAIGLMFVLVALLGVFTLLAIIAFFVRAVDPKDKIAGLLIKIFPYSTIALVLACLAIVLTPTTRDVAAMYVVPAIVNDEKLQDTGNRLYTLAVEWLDSLRPAKGDNDGK